MILYDRHHYNCAHYAVSELNKAHGLNIQISDGDEWQVRFLYALRRFFKPVDKPVNDCLVVMRNWDNSLHVGIYRNYQVIHNWQSSDRSAGQVIRSDLSTIRAKYIEVRFYGRNDTTISPQ